MTIEVPKDEGPHESVAPAPTPVLRLRATGRRIRSGLWISLPLLVLLAGCQQDAATDGPRHSSDDVQSSTQQGSYSLGEACVADSADPDEIRSAEAPGVPWTSLPKSISVTIETNQGKVPITLDAESSPCAVENLLSLAAKDFFDATRCHRLTTKHIYILQCGDPTGTGEGGPGYTIVDEFDGSESYPPGTVAMARRMDKDDSAGSQFFFVYDGRDDQLPAEFTRLGTVSGAGMKVLRAIASKGTAAGTVDGPPKDPVVIEDVGQPR